MFSGESSTALLAHIEHDIARMR